MSPARIPIAVIFDFDDTLAPDTTSGFLESIGIEPRTFWREAGQRIESGWDPVPAYLQMMIERSRAMPRGERITKRRLAAWGARAPLFTGAQQIFGRLRKQFASHKRLQLEFYVISSGIGDVLRGTKVFGELTDLWASEFAYNPAGEIDALRSVISFTDKTRYLFHISKGLIGAEWRGRPFAVNQKVDESKLRIPFTHMVMVGDGYTDIPSFSLVQKNGGVAIGVYDRESRERWGKAWGFIEERRVSHLVAADYRRQRGLDDALSIAIESIASKIELKSVSYQG